MKDYKIRSVSNFFGKRELTLSEYDVDESETGDRYKVELTVNDDGRDASIPLTEPQLVELANKILSLTSKKI